MKKERVNENKETVLVTGGLGFIGSHFIQLLLERGHKVINIDKVTYASNEEIGKEFEKNYPNEYTFIKKDIAELDELPFCNYIVHFAAESHVDNSIRDSSPFIQSNIIGTYNLLRLLIKSKADNMIHFWHSKIPIFIYIGTDEIFGDIEEGFFKEGDCYNPSNPYSASKAAAELLVKSWSRTYGIQYKITRTTNNYGERQHPEKLIPMAITQALSNKKIIIHGDGSYIRNWIYVKDNCEAIYTIMKKGSINQDYHISSNEEYSVNDIVKMILKCFNKSLNSATCEYIQNRAGQDVRYALNSDKIKKIGWKQKHNLIESLPKMIKYYLKR